MICRFLPNLFKQIGEGSFFVNGWVSMKKCLGYFVIPVSCIAYAAQASLLRENFTGIANKQHQVIYLWLLSLMIGGYDYIYSISLFKKYEWKPKWVQILSVFAFILCVMNPLIPYQTDQPHLASLHVLISMSSCVLFIALHLLFLGHINERNVQLYQKNNVRLLLMIVTIILVMFSFGSINSLVECIIVVWMNIYIIRFDD